MKGKSVAINIGKNLPVVFPINSTSNVIGEVSSPTVWVNTASTITSGLLLMDYLNYHRLLQADILKHY